MTVKDLLGEYFTESEVMEATGWTKPTLQSKRCRDIDHPRFIKRGKNVLYPKADFVRWFSKGATKVKSRLKVVR